jgi:hypothetical protein
VPGAWTIRRRSKHLGNRASRAIPHIIAAIPDGRASFGSVRVADIPLRSMLQQANAPAHPVDNHAVDGTEKDTVNVPFIRRRHRTFFLVDMVGLPRRRPRVPTISLSAVCRILAYAGQVV